MIHEDDPLAGYPPMMSAAQVAEVLDVTEQVLGTWRQQRVGPSYVKMLPGKRGTVRYERGVIRAFIKANTVQCDPVPGTAVA